MTTHRTQIIDTPEPRWLGGKRVECSCGWTSRNIGNYKGSQFSELRQAERQHMNDLEVTQAERARDANLIYTALRELEHQAANGLLPNGAFSWAEAFNCCNPEPLDTLCEALRQWQQDRETKTLDEPF